MNILIVTPMSWGRNAGGPQVNYMIARELRRLGHTVEKYDIDDAFPEKNKFVQYLGTGLFRLKAFRHVRRVGYKYDVIQAEQGILPFSKTALNFDGVLISSSVGLAHFYKQYQQEYAEEIRARHPRSILGRTVEWVSGQLNNPTWAIERSFDKADIISLSGEDEYEYVSDVLGYQEKAFLRQNALTRARIENLAQDACSPSARLANQVVAFIGHWNHRKGAADWRVIIDTVRRKNPEARFLLLGTGKSKREVLSDISESAHPQVKVVPSYEYDDLPQLLSDVTVGVLPSYVEGMPIAVLEMLAACLPVVAYDVPGPRDMLRHFHRPMMSQKGHSRKISGLIVELLSLSEKEYAELAGRAKDIADHFRWDDIVEKLHSEISHSLNN